MILQHLHQRFLGFGTLGMAGVVHKVAPGPELAVSMLVIVAAHLLFKCGLMLLEFGQPVRKKAVLAVVAEAGFTETATKFEFAFGDGDAVVETETVGTDAHVCVISKSI